MNVSVRTKCYIIVLKQNKYIMFYKIFFQLLSKKKHTFIPASLFLVLIRSRGWKRGSGLNSNEILYFEFLALYTILCGLWIGGTVRSLGM